jgi:hypothetical protein
VRKPWLELEYLLEPRSNRGFFPLDKCSEAVVPCPTIEQVACRLASSLGWFRPEPGHNLLISYEAAYPAGATLILSQQHDWGRWQNGQS